MLNSRENKKFKLLLSLKKNNKRKKNELILIEGQKEIRLAKKSGVEILEVYYSAGQSELIINDVLIGGIELSPTLFSDISYRDKSSGVIALAKRPKKNSNDLNLSRDSLILVMESPEKPGNIGAVLRTADAVGVDLIIICSPNTDLYNPNVIRASLGAVFTVPSLLMSNEEALEFLKKNKANVYSASLEASIDFRELSYQGATAIAIGTEHDGLSEFWTNNSDANIKIPMKGTIDSLNASVSAAIILYEAQRQRKK
jgi:TrmH family RNA methyltransferase